MTTRIAITDDHTLVLQGINSMLGNTPEIEVVGLYENAKETLENIHAHGPDVLFLDINLPDSNGVDLSKQLLEEYPDLKIIALTSFDDVSVVKKMLRNGVHGYLLKNTDKLELIDALETVLSGQQYLHKDIQEKLLNLSSTKKEANSFLTSLTRREIEVVKAIADELTTTEISDKLFISPKTVETHRMNIMSKLGAKNIVGIIKSAMENGLLD